MFFPMKKRELVFSWIYLIIHTAVLPAVIPLLFPQMSAALMNLVYYLFSAAVVFIFLFRYLRSSFDILCDNKLLTFFAVLRGFLIYYLLSYAVGLIELMIGGGTAASPNNESILEIADMDFGKMAATAVFLAPLVEEPLFRGAIFGPLRKKHRVAAYAVCSVLFAFYHLASYFFREFDPMLFVALIQYLPAGIALCWTYEHGGGIWSSILLHASINIFAFTLM